MREWGAEALTSLIKAGLTFNHDPPLSQNQVEKNLFKKRIFNVKSSSSICNFFLIYQMADIFKSGFCWLFYDT